MGDKSKFDPVPILIVVAGIASIGAIVVIVYCIVGIQSIEREDRYYDRLKELQQEYPEQDLWQQEEVQQEQERYEQV